MMVGGCDHHTVHGMMVMARDHHTASRSLISRVHSPGSNFPSLIPRVHSPGSPESMMVTIGDHHMLPGQYAGHQL